MIRHNTDIRVRYADTDKMTFVYNAVYMVYFEVGRNEFLRAYGAPYVDIERAGFLLPLLEAHLNYKAPAFYDDLLTVCTSFNGLVAPKIRMDYSIERRDTVIVTGHTVHAFVDAQTHRPVRPPKIFSNAIESALSK